MHARNDAAHPVARQATSFARGSWSPTCKSWFHKACCEPFLALITGGGGRLGACVPLQWAAHLRTGNSTSLAQALQAHEVWGSSAHGVVWPGCRSSFSDPGRGCSTHASGTHITYHGDTCGDLLLCCCSPMVMRRGCCCWRRPWPSSRWGQGKGFRRGQEGQGLCCAALACILLGVAPALLRYCHLTACTEKHGQSRLGSPGRCCASILMNTALRCPGELQGSYHNLDGGSTLWALEALTGDYVFKFKMEGPNAVGTSWGLHSATALALPAYRVALEARAACAPSPRSPMPSAARGNCSSCSSSGGRGNNFGAPIMILIGFPVAHSGGGSSWCTPRGARAMSCFRRPRTCCPAMRCLRPCSSTTGGEASRGPSCFLIAAGNLCQPGSACFLLVTMRDSEVAC